MAKYKPEPMTMGRALTIAIFLFDLESEAPDACPDWRADCRQAADRLRQIKRGEYFKLPARQRRKLEKLERVKA